MLKMLTQRVDELENSLTKEIYKKEDSYRREAQLESDIRELRRIKFKRFNDDECWIYQGDGEDYPDSLVCPVVMSADDFREFMKLKNEKQ